MSLRCKPILVLLRVGVLGALAVDGRLPGDEAPLLTSTCLSLSTLPPNESVRGLWRVLRYEERPGGNVGHTGAVVIGCSP